MTVPSTMTHSQSASPRSASRARCQTPFRFHRLKRVKTVFQGPKDSGRSLQGAPVLCFQRMASTMGRLSSRGRPIPPCSLGSRGPSLAHIRSVRKVLATHYLNAIPMRYRSCSICTSPYIQLAFSTLKTDPRVCFQSPTAPRRRPAGMHRKEEPAGQRGSLFTIRNANRALLAKPIAGAQPRGPKARARGTDDVGRPAGPVPKGWGGGLRQPSLASLDRRPVCLRSAALSGSPGAPSAASCDFENRP